MALDVPPWARKVLRFWEIPFLGILAWMMFRVRMLPYDKLVADGRAYYIGTDPFYHFREILGGVRAWPAMPRFDPYTYYPIGTGTGQFGSLFDRVASTYIYFTAGRDASETYVHEVVAAYPAVLGALLIVPFYFLAKRLLGTPGAIVASVTLSVLPGEFLIRSVAGYSDHHVAEALMALVAILGVYVAVEKGHAMRDRLGDIRDVRSYWPVLAWGGLGGLALFAEFYTWPPAILFLAILTIWLTIVMLLENARGVSARGHALAGASAFAVAGVLMIPLVESTFLGEFNTYSVLHPLALFLAAGWLLLLDFVVERLEARGMARTRAAGIVGGVVAGGGVLAFLLVFIVPAAAFGAVGINPAIISSLRWGLSWITGVGVPRTTTTISEARPADIFCSADSNTASCLGNDFGLVAPFSAIILVGLVAFAIWKRRPSDILLALWSVIIFQATNTQIRFSYYVALNMALLIGWLGARIAEGAGATAARDAPAPSNAKGQKGRRTRAVEHRGRDGAPWRAVAAVLALLLVLPGNVFATERSRPGWETADLGFSGPDGDLLVWIEAFEWMRNNTPDAGVDLGRIVEPPRAGESFEQSPESYGVLSWWDYGHWMEVVARRAPVANPFQQAAPFASCYFTERDPARAEAMLRLWSARAWDRPEGLPCDDVDLPALDALPLTDKNPVRYVMIDDEMAAGKFGAITVWAGCDECLAFNRLDASRQFADRASYYDALFKYWRNFVGPDGNNVRMPWSGEPYHDTMLARLYYADGNSLDNYRLVHETQFGRRIGWLGAYGADGQFFSDAQSAILSGYERFPANEWGALPDGVAVRTGDDKLLYDSAAVASVKTYERVKGATLAGSGATPNAQVSVTIALQSDTTGRQFEWTTTTTADASGAFLLNVPYATSDYRTTEQGGTALSVRALGPALVRSGTLSVDVPIPDAAVLDGATIAVAL